MPFPADGADRRAVVCTVCRRRTRVMTSFAEQVTVIEGPGGAITTRSEQVLERRCGWCGTAVTPARPVQVRDLPSL